MEELNTLLRALDQNKTKIAAICGGPTFLAHAGLLANRKCTGSVAEDEKRFFIGTLFHDVDVVRDGHILTALYLILTGRRHGGVISPPGRIFH